MGNIDWIPIEYLPDALKDGREVLLWQMGRPYAAWWNETLGWVSTGDVEIEFATHFAEINPPA